MFCWKIHELISIFSLITLSTLIPQKDVQALYHVECKVLDYNGDNYSEEGKKTQSFAD